MNKNHKKLRQIKVMAAAIAMATSMTLTAMPTYAAKIDAGTIDENIRKYDNIQKVILTTMNHEKISELIKHAESNDFAKGQPDADKIKQALVKYYKETDSFLQTNYFSAKFVKAEVLDKINDTMFYRYSYTNKAVKENDFKHLRELLQLDAVDGPDVPISQPPNEDGKQPEMVDKSTDEDTIDSPFEAPDLNAGKKSDKATDTSEDMNAGENDGAGAGTGTGSVIGSKPSDSPDKEPANANENRKKLIENYNLAKDFVSDKHFGFGNDKLGIARDIAKAPDMQALNDDVKARLAHQINDAKFEGKLTDDEIKDLKQAIDNHFEYWKNELAKIDAKYLYILNQFAAHTAVDGQEKTGEELSKVLTNIADGKLKIGAGAKESIAEINRLAANWSNFLTKEFKDKPEAYIVWSPKKKDETPIPKPITPPTNDDSNKPTNDDSSKPTNDDSNKPTNDDSNKPTNDDKIKPNVVIDNKDKLTTDKKDNNLSNTNHSSNPDNNLNNSKPGNVDNAGAEPSSTAEVTKLDNGKRRVTVNVKKNGIKMYIYDITDMKENSTKTGKELEDEMLAKARARDFGSIKYYDVKTSAAEDGVDGQITFEAEAGHIYYLKPAEDSKDQVEDTVIIVPESDQIKAMNDLSAGRYEASPMTGDSNHLGMLSTIFSLLGVVGLITAIAAAYINQRKNNSSKLNLDKE